MNKIKWITVLITAALILVLANPSSILAANGSLITEAELNSRLSAPNTVIIDVSSPETYALGHIPGAINITRADLLDPGNPTPSEILTAAQLQELFSRKGIRNGDTLLIYGETPPDGTRLWWTLKYYGLQDMALLNGSLKTWQDAGYDVSTDLPPAKTSEFILDPQLLQAALNASNAQVAASLGGKAWIVDARSPVDYSGRVLTKGAARRGRIPGAVNVFWQDLLDSQGRFKSAAEIQAIYTKQGITCDTIPIIVTCHSGFQSSVNFFVLTEILGYGNIANHDASWLSWSQDSSLPVECDYSRFTIGSPDYELRSAAYTMDAAPYVKSGRTYMPLRYVALSLGIAADGIQWDAPGKTVTLSKGSDTVKLIMGQQTIWINGQEKAIDAMPEMQPPGRILLPVRAVVEALQGSITWDEATDQVWVSSRDSQVAATGGG